MTTESTDPLAQTFAGKEVLITGGLGFIGSTLAMRLVSQGARVTLLDAMLEGHGGNPFNIAPIADLVQVNYGDIRALQALRYLCRGKDYIFHLAGQNDHVLSQKDPFPDISINIEGTAKLLEAVKASAPEARLIYTGTRGEYGSSASLPVSEDAPLNPKGIYELSSLTAQRLFRIYHDNHNLRSITLRLTNIYGPRAQMLHHRFGVANWFMRLALEDQTIRVFGDGSLIRDFVYVDDAVDAILRCAACEDAYGHTFNVGNDQPSTFLELARTIVDAAGTGRWEFAPFSPERAAQEPGDFYSDITHIRTVVGWTPQTSLVDGVAQTLAYYRKHCNHYWTT